jgi:hypothetical protein
MYNRAILILSALGAVAPHGLWDAQAQSPEQIHNNCTNYYTNEHGC